LELPLGRKLASGRDADVFALADGSERRVLRRYRSGARTPSGAAKTSEYEAEIMRLVAAQGFPVPAVHAVSGPDMVMDRVDGPTMLADLARRPWTVWGHARLLARLHRRLHRIAAPDWVQTYAAHPAFAVAAPDPVVSVAPPVQDSAAETTPLLSDTLLHLDLHPDNVILSDNGPVVIDWRNTRRGNGAIDVASTWLIMATSELPETGLKGAARDVIRRLFVYAFLHHTDRRTAGRQIPLVARYRLADRNLLPSERPAILALARRACATP
jgi:aminoglycoside phosphotransferase (APT) family kinase protein